MVELLGSHDSLATRAGGRKHGVSGEERLEVVPPLGVAHRAAKELLEDRARRLLLLVSDEADTCDE